VKYNPSGIFAPMQCCILTIATFDTPRERRSDLDAIAQAE
jgi:hypothetical protein